MTTKVVTYGVVGLLALALAGGTVYTLAKPTTAQAQLGSGGGQGQTGSGGGVRRGGVGDGLAGGPGGAGQGERGGRGVAGGEGESRGQGSSRGAQQAELSEAEIQGVLYMREEEKLARDVYLTLHEQWQLPVFENIANSEQTHMDAVATLLSRYDLDDPAEGSATGEFSDPALQELYDDLVSAGSASLGDALRVGAAIEEIDILDLERYVSQTDRRDLGRVYESLARGSRNHLRAFVATLERETGEAYQPQYLDDVAFEEILAGATGGWRGEAGQGIGGAGQGHGGESGSETGQSRQRGSGGAGTGSANRGAYGTGSESGAPAVEWQTISGTVTAVDGEVALQTAEGEALVSMGQTAYWQGFALAVGNDVVVTGFYEDGEFKAGAVQNLTTGASISLRDQSGRPLWSGRGRSATQSGSGG